MPRNVFSTIALAASSLLCGCSSAPVVYGNEARFSPAYQGYVMAQHDGSDDPGIDEAVIVLRDPLTGDKLRCQEQVLRFRELHEDLAVDQVHDDNVALGVGIATVAVFAPLIAAEPVGAALLAEAMMTGADLNDLLQSDDGWELYAAGVVLFERTRFRQAVTVLELAMAKEGAVALADKAYYYLGVAYLEMGDLDRAKTALSLFVHRSMARDVKAYRDALEHLERLGGQPGTCESSEPVKLHW